MPCMPGGAAAVAPEEADAGKVFKHALDSEAQHLACGHPAPAGMEPVLQQLLEGLAGVQVGLAAVQAGVVAVQADQVALHASAQVRLVGVSDCTALTEMHAPLASLPTHGRANGNFAAASAPACSHAGGTLQRQAACTTSVCAVQIGSQICLVRCCLFGRAHLAKSLRCPLDVTPMPRGSTWGPCRPGA